MRQWTSVVAVVFAAILSTGGSCGGGNPPNPVPTPTPTPSPTPSPGERLVKIVGNKFQPRLRMAIPCCSGNGAIDISRGWPGAANEWIDAFHLGGWNAIHIRTIMFSDQGYGWRHALDASDAAVKYALSKNMIVEVDLLDFWPLKHVTPNLYNDSCEVTQGALPINYQWAIRYVVQRLGQYPNVIFNTGNEGFDCHPETTQAFEDGIYNTAKQAMRDARLPDIPVGSTFKLGAVGAGGRRIYDYATVHGFGFQPPLPDKPVFLTESDNQPHGYDAWRALEQQYKDADMSFGLWRGPEPDDVWYRLIGASYATASQQTASACQFNEWKLHVGYEARETIYPPESWFERIHAAEAAVIARRPDLFAPGSWCLISNTYQNRIDVASEIQRELQPGCTIVGSTDCPTCNPFWDMDSFDVQLSKGDLVSSPPQDYPLPIFPAPQTGVYCGQHYIAHGNGCFIPVRNAFRACGLYTVEEPVPSSSPSPGPTPTPDPTQTCGALGGTICNQGNMECPAGYQALASSDCNPCCKPNPEPTPTPPAGDCPLTLADVDWWRTEAKSQPTNQQIDITPVACGPRVVAALNACGTQCCALSAEKGNQACADALYGQPDWTVTAGVRLVQVYPDNSYTQKVAEGTGTAVVCGIDARSCVRFPVQSTPPACPMVPGSNQGCALQ